tara:strand:- start:16114 stop:16494 length:381 start_codon:yes stop_codon:yes gene_type:complete
MAEGLEQQLAQPATHAELGFEERLTLMVDRETTHHNNNKVARLLKATRLKQQAHPEEIDYQHSRGMQRSQFADLLSSRWIHQHHNVLITGPNGCGTTYLRVCPGESGPPTRLIRALLPNFSTAGVA